MERVILHIDMDAYFASVEEKSNPYLSGGAEETAKRIKERIKKELGLTCSVGMAANKLLAKLASDQEKPVRMVGVSVSNLRKRLRPGIILPFRRRPATLSFQKGVW